MHYINALRGGGCAPSLKRASLAVRWGVAVKYQAKDRFEGSPRAVGVVQGGWQSFPGRVGYRKSLFDDSRLVRAEYATKVGMLQKPGATNGIGNDH